MFGRWKNTLELSDLWKRMEAAEIEPFQAAGEIAKRLKAFCFVGITTSQRDHILAIARNFEAMEGDEADQDAFDALLAELYDWSDFNKTCWIETRGWKTTA